MCQRIHNQTDNPTVRTPETAHKRPKSPPTTARRRIIFADADAGRLLLQGHARHIDLGQASPGVFLADGRITSAAQGRPARHGWCQPISESLTSVTRTPGIFIVSAAASPTPTPWASSSTLTHHDTRR